MKRTEFTKPWLDALRSGAFKQGTDALVRDGSYCCLGVGGLLAGCADMELDSDDAYIYIRERLGVSLCEQDVLVELNDYQEKSFPEIADEIELMLEPA